MRPIGEAMDRLKIWTTKKTVETLLDVKLPITVEDVQVLDKEISEILLQNYALWDLIADLYIKLYSEAEFDERMKHVKVDYEQRSGRIQKAIENITTTVQVVMAAQEKLGKPPVAVTPEVK